MISLPALARLAAEHRDDLDLPVAPLRIGEHTFDPDARPVVMGCVNLSTGSAYRDSIALSARSAVRKGQIQSAQGADVIDIGAESSSLGAVRVRPQDQAAALVPVVAGLSDLGVATSVETHDPDVARACLKAGASVLNYNGGAAHDAAVFDVAAEFGALVVLCYVPGDDVHDVQRLGPESDLVPVLLDHFPARIADARARGVDNLVLDPAIGFSFAPSATADDRVRRQGQVLLNAFRLRRLGLPICQALPHAFHVFEDQFRTAEGFFAVLAALGGCGMVRTHEVARVVPVLDALRLISPR